MLKLKIMLWICGLLFLLTLNAGCRKTIITKIPNCPAKHLIVKIKKGTISGKDLENIIENHINDHICIERLKALLGKKFPKKMLK